VVTKRTRRRLILSADDFGMSSGVNAGVLRAHRDGVLTAASLMVTGAAAAEAVAIARDHPRLAVGLHLVLVQGRAASPAPTVGGLVDGGGWLDDSPLRAGLRYFFLPRLRAQLRREIAAQLGAFRATGLPLSHVDGHLHIHLHPAVLRILIDLAAANGVRSMRLTRDPLPAALSFDRRHIARKIFEATVFAFLSGRAAGRLRRRGFFYADQVFGLHRSGHLDEAYLLNLLPRLRPGVTEIYGHPGLWDEESRRWRPADYDPEAELEALTSRMVRRAVEDNRIELTTYAAAAEDCE